VSKTVKQKRVNERLEIIDDAILNLQKGKNKLSISKIAEKAGIARKTIYNNPELKERCDQAIQVQQMEQSNVHPKVKKPLSGRKLLEKRYSDTKIKLKEEQKKNAMLLENNRQLVLEKDQLKSHIRMLQNKIERNEKQKVKHIK